MEYRRFWDLSRRDVQASTRNSQWERNSLLSGSRGAEAIFHQQSRHMGIGLHFIRTRCPQTSLLRGDWVVMEYSLSQAKLDIPDFSSAYTEYSKCVLAVLIRTMLQVDETSRPSAISIVEALSISNGYGRVWISGCKHEHGN